MPIENTSSNTEMVSVQATIESLEEAYAGDSALEFMNDAAQLLRQFKSISTLQQQGEPVALPERKEVVEEWATPGGPYRAEGWNACLDEIAKLGPLYIRPVQGEPVGTLLIDEYFDGREVGDVDVQLDTKVCEQLADKYPGQSLPLYICPAPAVPGEVERLHKGHIKSLEALNEQTQKQRDHWMAECKKRDAQLAERDALLDRVVDHANFWHDHPYAEVVEAIAKDYKALSASAEPSAPVERDDEYDYRTDLAAYFGLSYASWLTLPRVLMEAMPKSWQAAMATLLHQYDDAYPNQPDLGTTVRVTENGKIVRTPEWLENYRHPDHAMLSQLRSEPGKSCNALERRPS